MNYFENPRGKYIEMIFGQERLAYSQSDTEDFYDMIGWAERGGYQGAVITFYDLENGKVYEPFLKQRNVLYGRPVFIDGYYYFLQGDFNKKKITLYRFRPEEAPAAVTELSSEEVSLYNLQVMGNTVHIVSQNDRFACYYPQSTAFDLYPEETVEFIENDRVYSERWVEEGWDKEKDCATEDYRFYNKVVVRNLQGEILSEEVGSLFQAPDGSWWIG